MLLLFGYRFCFFSILYNEYCTLFLPLFYRQTIIPYEDVVAVRTSRSPQLIQKAAAAANQKQQQSSGGGGGGFRFWRSRAVARGDEDRAPGGVNVNKFGFLGAPDSGLGDTLDIYYVPEASYTNKFTLEKVGKRPKYSRENSLAAHIRIFYS